MPAGELIKLTKHKPNAKIACIYGGVPIGRQIFALESGAQIVVGTPGRILDHINRGTLKLDSVRFAVLDEADEMLDMGFREDIDAILAATPGTRQTALFSATMPFQILQLAGQYLHDPVRVTTAVREMTVEKIDQYYISVRSFHKGELLSRLLTLEDIRLALVFCNTKQEVETVVTDLQRRGFSAAGLHGDMRQIERDAVMARYRRGLVGVLVATDVAARGLDIDDIEVVINYDIPLDVEYYVHRIGRTGRAGKEGRAYTFVVGREVSRMWDYRRITGAKILCRRAPDANEVAGALSDRLLKRILARIDAESDENAASLANRLLENGDAAGVLSAALSLLISAEGARTDTTIDLDPPQPERPPRPAMPPTRRGPYGRPAPSQPQNRPYGRRPRFDRKPDENTPPRSAGPAHRPKHPEKGISPRRVKGKK